MRGGIALSERDHIGSQAKETRKTHPMDKASKPLVLFAPVSVQGFVYPRSSILAMDQKHIPKILRHPTLQLVSFGKHLPNNTGRFSWVS